MNDILGQIRFKLKFGAHHLGDSQANLLTFTHTHTQAHKHTESQDQNICIKFIVLGVQKTDPRGSHTNQGK